MGKKGKVSKTTKTEKDLSPAETKKLEKEIKKCEINHNNPADVNKCIERAVDKVLGD